MVLSRIPSSRGSPSRRRLSRLNVNPEANLRGATTIYWLSFGYWLLSCCHVFLVKERKEILLFVLTVAVLLAFALWPKDSESVLVKREGQVRPDSVVPEASIAKRYRHVQLEPAAIQSVREGEQVIELELFPGETIRVRLQESEQTGQQSTEVYGSIEGVPGSMVTLVTYEDVLAGTVQYPDGRTFMVNYAGDAEHSIVELDSDAMQAPPDLQEHFAAQPPVRSPDGTVTMAPQLQYGVTHRVPGFPQFTYTLNGPNPWPTQVLLGPINYGPPIVGIMVVYTPTAKKECAGLCGVESRIRLSVAQVNVAFRRSLITAKLVLLNTAEVEYSTVGNLHMDLINLTFGLTPKLREVHKLRQANRADLVSLFVGGSPQIFHGISWMLNDMRPAANYGFNVPTSVFAHEIGHNLGCQHATNDFDGSIKGVFTNSHGLRFNTTFAGRSYPMRTIMAYGAGPRLGYYSNPNVQVWGAPTGITNSANNAYTISQTAPMVGSYMTEIIHTMKLGPNAQPSIKFLPGTATRPGLRQRRRAINFNLSGD